MYMYIHISMSSVAFYAQVYWPHVVPSLAMKAMKAMKGRKAMKKSIQGQGQQWPMEAKKVPNGQKKVLFSKFWPTTYTGQWRFWKLSKIRKRKWDVEEIWVGTLLHPMKAMKAMKGEPMKAMKAMKGTK
jgi:hypothetical protein